MSKDNLYCVVETIFLSAVIISGISFTLVSAFDFQRDGAIWAVSLSTVIVSVICAIVLSLIVILLLRLTGVSWFWSIISGVLIIVIYSTFMTLLFEFLGNVMAAWLFG